MAQAIRRSPSNSGLPSSRLGHSMWVSWWTDRSLCRFSHQFSTLISFILFNFIRPVMVRQAWTAGILAIHRPSIKRLHRISSLCPALCRATSYGYFFKLVIAKPVSVAWSVESMPSNPAIRFDSRWGQEF